MDQASCSTPMNWLIHVPWMPIAASHNYRTIETVHLWRPMHMWHAPAHQKTCAQIAVLDQDPFQPFHNDTFRYYYIWLYKLSIQHHLILHLHFIMNATDYWLLAREYSIWNAMVAALQFWTPDLEAHVLSSVIDKVYNAFFYTTSMHLLCQQSEEVFISVTLWPHLMQPLIVNSPWKTKDMRVGVKISTYPLLSDEPPETYTMLPVAKRSPLTLQLHTAQLPVSHIANLYIASYHSVLLMMNNVLQLTLHLITLLYHHRTPWLCTAATFQVHLYHMWWPRRRREFSNSYTRWWPLDYERNPR